MGTIRFDGITFDPAIVRMAGRAFRRENEGRLPTGDDAFSHVWDTLRERRELNPTRFDRWHPRAGRWLAVDEEVRMQPTVGVPPIVPRPPPVQVVPEPWSGLMLAIGLAWVVLRSRRR